jgi:hypothetical protein
VFLALEAEAAEESAAEPEFIQQSLRASSFSI